MADSVIDTGSTFEISVIVPTFNGESRLPDLFKSFQKFIIPPSFRWEIIVIDNNSGDRTADVVRSWQDSWTTCPLRYGFEPYQGAAYARWKGIDLAQGRYVIFVDDDNVLVPHWITAAWKFAQTHPNAGAIAGPVVGDYETPPPENFEQIEKFLAVRDYPDYDNQPCLFAPQNLQLPPSAALLVDRLRWLNSVPRQQLLTGKTPQFLLQGDDYEPLLYLHKHGWEIWFNPELVSHHKIPQWRLTQKYLTQLARGCGLATYALRLINAPRSQHRYLAFKTSLGSLKRLLVKGIEWAIASGALKRVIAIEIVFLWGTFESPIFYHRKIRKKSPPQIVEAKMQQQYKAGD
ncbi:MAG: hormogonium polysaccharide biosynthesis glycosyltransferase HpsE [Cyanobacteria bacterium P01_C01_bin.89]